MPRLSIVLVAHREQGFLRAALTSVLSQAPDDVQVLVIDDAAADHCGEIAEEVAARDDRVAVRHLAPRQGQGPARRAALASVTGDYVWFMEPTDLVAPGGLERVLARLAETGPDVLVVPHLVQDVYGARSPGLSAAGGRSSQLWDKVVRTGFLAGLDPDFDTGAGWELDLTWALLLAARSIEVLPEPAYVRRDLPPAVRARSAVGTPLDALEAYQRVLSRVADSANRRAVLASFAAAAPGLLRATPPALREQAFALVAAIWRDHRDLLENLMDLDPARRAALDRGSLPAWRAAGEAAKVPRSVRAVAGPLLRNVRHPRRLVRRARRVRSLPTRAYYRAELRAPLEENLVVYAAYWYSAYSCNPRAIYEKARELAPWLHGVWVVNPDKVGAIPAGVDYVVAGSRAYYRVMARAKYFVNNVNFPNDIVKRRGQVHVQTHHGTPLKTMGMDLASSTFTERKMNFPKLMKRIERWDISISQNVFTSEQWERVYPSGTFDSVETGYPRNDVLANATDDDVARVRASLGIATGRTAVLYLPTHREYHPGYVPQLDPARLADALGPDHVLLMRTHYFYRDADATGAQPATGTVLDVADHPRIEDLYLAADVLVTDYSSAMFDYAVLDRPIVIYAPDWEEYRELRGTTFDLMAEPPGAVARTEQELTDVLASRAAWDDESTARRQTFRARFCSLEDGMASDRVVHLLWPAPPGGHA